MPTAASVGPVLRAGTPTAPAGSAAATLPGASSAPGAPGAWSDDSGPSVARGPDGLRSVIPTGSGGPESRPGAPTGLGATALGGPELRSGTPIGSGGPESRLVTPTGLGATALGGRELRPGTPTAASVGPSEVGEHPVGSGESAAPPVDAPGGVPDLRRIVGAGVRVVAVPVAADMKAQAQTLPPPQTPPQTQPPTQTQARPSVRRRTVIGAETTGSIPVHLLFREEPDDDGGPDTVAMAPPVPAASPTPKAVIPAPTRSHPARPAPTADPKLVERDGPVLPGWIGVVAGMLALAGCAAVLWWTGAVPEQLARMLRLPPRPYHGIHLGQWALLALGVLITLFSFGGLGRGRVGYAWVLTLFGDYRGSVRRTGLVWMSPLLLRRRVDVRLRHWRSEPLSAVDAKGTALHVVVLVVWRIRDTVRAALGVDGHEEYLREQVEAAMARVLSQLPADAFHEDAPTLRDAEAVGEALTRMISAECAPVGIDVFSAQPTRIEYAPEIAAAMQRRRIAAIDAKHRDSVLTSVVDAVDDVVHRLTTRGLVELDDYERKALVKDLTVAFYTGRTASGEGA
nr:SPFH domain-containing protein [Streptomyces vilmorinianum]